MKTATKNSFTEGEIRSVVHKHFPEEAITEIIPISGGTFNTLYRINGTGALSEGIMLKTGPSEGVEVPNHEKDILRTEVYAYQILEGYKVPVPKLYGYDFSKTLLPCGYFLMERMQGEPWFDHWPIRDPGLMRALGKYTARMHNAGMSWFGEISDDASKRFDTWGAFFTAMIEDILDEIQRQNLKLPFEGIRHAVNSRRNMLDELKKPSLINFDLWAGNVLVQKREDRYYLTGMIDFERSFLGDPLVSFASALLLYDNVEKETAFLEGYNKVSEEPLVITDKDREKLALYEMLMYLRAYGESQRYRFWFRGLQRFVIKEIIAYLLHRLKRMEKKRSKKQDVPPSF